MQFSPAEDSTPKHYKCVNDAFEEEFIRNREYICPKYRVRRNVDMSPEMILPLRPKNEKFRSALFYEKLVDEIFSFLSLFLKVE